MIHAPTVVSFARTPSLTTRGLMRWLNQATGLSIDVHIADGKRRAQLPLANQIKNGLARQGPGQKALLKAIPLDSFGFDHPLLA